MMRYELCVRWFTDLDETIDDPGEGVQWSNKHIEEGYAKVAY